MRNKHLLSLLQILPGLLVLYIQKIISKLNTSHKNSTLTNLLNCLPSFLWIWCKTDLSGYLEFFSFTLSKAFKLKFMVASATGEGPLASKQAMVFASIPHLDLQSFSYISKYSLRPYVQLQQ